MKLYYYYHFVYTVLSLKMTDLKNLSENGLCDLKIYLEFIALNWVFTHIKHLSIFTQAFRRMYILYHTQNIYLKLTATTRASKVKPRKEFSVFLN